MGCIGDYRNLVVMDPMAMLKIQPALHILFRAGSLPLKVHQHTANGPVHLDSIQHTSNGSVHLVSASSRAHAISAAEVSTLFDCDVIVAGLRDV